MTAPAHLHNIFNGIFLDAIFLGVTGVVVVSIHVKINSCVNVLVLQPLACVLFAGVS